MIVGRIPSNGAPSRANARVPTAWSAGTGYSIWACDEALNLCWGQDAHETWYGILNLVSGQGDRLTRAEPDDTWGKKVVRPVCDGLPFDGPEESSRV